jgi:hypothetical protein
MTAKVMVSSLGHLKTTVQDLSLFHLIVESSRSLWIVESSFEPLLRAPQS